MTRKFLDKVYSVSDAPDDQKALYDAWADSYDDELRDNRYATPGRLAEALASVMADRARPVLDFGCGTGLSGEALAQAGFTTIDGCDLSPGMVEGARAKGVYRNLWVMEPGLLEVAPGAYDAIVACGVISVGAAPPETMELIASRVAPGGLLAFSLNDHSIDVPDYIDRVDTLGELGFVERVRAHGTHIAARDLGSTVFVLERST